MAQKEGGSKDANLAGKGANLTSLLDSAYIVIALDGHVQEANISAQQLFGLTEESLVEHDFFKLWAVPNMGMAFIEQIINDRLVRGYMTDLKRVDGSTFIASINAQLVINQTDYSKVIECLISDITSTQKKQEQFDETLRSVTGGIAHLINNQMASVVGTADLVKMELGDRPELAKKLEQISESGMQASDVAHNLVEFADTSNKLVFGDVHPDDLIRKVAEYYHGELASSQPRSFLLKRAGDLHRIFGNEECLVKMLKRLVINAVEATKDGGTVIIKSKNVVLLNKKTGLNKNYVLIAVEDRGHGMDEETQKKIFDPFFSTRFAGRGMSLPQVLKGVKEHNGQIRIKTGVGKGSIFKVYLPAVE